jgi:hypothetical protein
VNFFPKELAKIVTFTLEKSHISKKKKPNFLGLKKRQKWSQKIQCNESVCGRRIQKYHSIALAPPVWGDSTGLNLLQTSQQPPSGVKTQGWELTQVPS